MSERMSNLINRQDAIDAIKSLWNNAPSAQHLSAMFDCEDAIRALPSPEPEIIRCKDCKFYTPMNRETKTGICNLTMHQNFGDEWYCAGAERRTDGRFNQQEDTVRKENKNPDCKDCDRRQNHI